MIPPEAVPDQRLLIHGVLRVRLRQVDEAALARVALVTEQEDVGTANHHETLLPNLREGIFFTLMDVGSGLIDRVID